MTGNQIRKKRLALGYTTDKLARKVGVSLSTIQKWERGVQPPNRNNLIRLYAAFGLGHPFKRELTDAQRLEEKKRRIELMAKLDAKVDESRKLGSWVDLDDNDPELIEFKKTDRGESMTKILKRLLCGHSRKEPFNKYVYTGKQIIFYRTKCKNCGKVWEL